MYTQKYRGSLWRRAGEGVTALYTAHCTMVGVRKVMYIVLRGDSGGDVQPEALELSSAPKSRTCCCVLTPR